MITVEFPCYTSFGKGDSTDWYLYCDLTEEEYELLVSVIKSEPEEEFFENKKLSDIFKKVYKEAVRVATEDALEYDEDIQERVADDPEWRIDWLYDVNVNYPEL